MARPHQIGLHGEGEIPQDRIEHMGVEPSLVRLPILRGRLREKDQGVKIRLFRFDDPVDENVAKLPL